MENGNSASIRPVEAAPAADDPHITIKIPKKGIRTFFKFFIPGLLLLSLGLNFVLLKNAGRRSHHIAVTTHAVQGQGSYPARKERFTEKDGRLKGGLKKYGEYESFDWELEENEGFGFEFEWKDADNAPAAPSIR